jgi:hypothetical protein
MNEENEGRRGRRKIPRTETTKTKKQKHIPAQVGQMESPVGFGILFFFFS